MFKNNNAFKLVCFVSILFVCACSEHKNVEAIKAVEKSNAKLRVIRFENELRSLQSITDVKAIATFNTKHFDFFDLFNTGIIRIGKSSSNDYNARLQDFLNDKYINQLFQSTDSIYHNFSTYESQLQEYFKYYKYYFPKKNIPYIYTFVSGFNCAVAPTDTILAIGLDYFLGSTRNYYTLLEFPEYQKRKLKPEYLTTTAFQQWIRTEFESDNKDHTLLAAIIAEGKVLYASKQCMPEVNDTIIFGFTQQQLEWCNNSEFEIWSFLIDKKLLYNTNLTEFNRYIADGPFTPGMPRESPARATCWLGYKIVDAFMKNNKNTDLEKLMKQTNSQILLNKSKYKPHK